MNHYLELELRGYRLYIVMLLVKIKYNPLHTDDTIKFNIFSFVPMYPIQV